MENAGRRLSGDAPAADYVADRLLRGKMQGIYGEGQRGRPRVPRGSFPLNASEEDRREARRIQRENGEKNTSLHSRVTHAQLNPRAA